jgi:hypothetical protein
VAVVADGREGTVRRKHVGRITQETTERQRTLRAIAQRRVVDLTGAHGSHWQVADEFIVVVVRRRCSERHCLLMKLASCLSKKHSASWRSAAKYSWWSSSLVLCSSGRAGTLSLFGVWLR